VIIAMVLLLSLGLAAGLAWHRGASRRRWLLLAGGSAALTVAWLPPLEALAAAGSLSAHLAQQLLILGVAPPLLLLGVPAKDRQRRPGWPVTVAGHPVVALILVNAVLALCSVPAVYDAGLQSSTLSALLEVALFAASLAFWRPMVGPEAHLSSVARLFYLVVATIPQTFAGLLLVFSPRVLYTGAAGRPGALADQQFAGAMLTVLSKVALFTAFGIILVRLFRDAGESEDDDGRDRPASSSGPPRRPAWRRAVAQPRPRTAAVRPSAWRPGVPARRVSRPAAPASDRDGRPPRSGGSPR
jgi:cytochrome c oxidase assembly factor CtaG